MVASSDGRKRILCAICSKKCTGSVLRYQEQYYHKHCFESDNRPELVYSSQSSSSNNTATATTAGGGFSPTGKPAPKPSISNNYPQQATSAYHVQEDSQSVQPNNNLNYHNYTHYDHNKHSQMQASKSLQQISQTPFAETRCAGCRQKIVDGQALVALDLHWHIWCFKCSHCQTALHGEYVAKDGKAYCEKDYQKLFGVICVYCKRYITGKVLQAGEAHHFHPSCARCSKCGDPFVPGEEMYLQGEVTWHPRCGPGPLDPSTGVLLVDHEPSGYNESSSRQQLRDSRGDSPSLSSRSRSASPFSYISRQYERASPGYADSEAVGDLSRIYTISYLNADPTQGYLRRPIEPSAPKSPQFSRPASVINRDTRSRSSSRSQCFGTRGSAISNRERSVPRGMYSVLSSMRSGSSVRARSPSMMNEEAIQLAAYPSGQKPSADAVPKIERDDFPAPPFPYSKSSGGSPAARRSSSNRDERDAEQAQADGQSPSSKGTSSKLEAAPGEHQRASRPRSREIVIDDDESSADDPQLRKEEEELSKIASGIGKIFLQTLKEREKLRAWKRANLDPRNASRTPSAQRELSSRPLRYENPLNASPSRDLDRPRPWCEEELEALSGEQSPTRTRSSLGKPSQLSTSNYGYKVVHSNRSTPKPGYGLATNGLSGGAGGSQQAEANEPPQATHYTLPAGSRLSSSQSMSFAQQQRNAQNRSTDLLLQSRTLPAQNSNGRLGRQLHSANPGSRMGLPNSPGSLYSSSPHLRRSVPNNLQHLHQEGPPKLFPYHLLATSNYRLPPGVDRCHLERHLSNEEFQYIFHCDRLDFYRLPEWKRNELKRRARLF